MDRLGNPPQQLEWDQKLWWVHIETLIAMLKGYQLTGDVKCLEAFHTVHTYTWEHFKDKEYPELHECKFPFFLSGSFHPAGALSPKPDYKES